MIDPLFKIDEFVFCGDRPDSAEDYDRLKALGIGAVLNLEYGFWDCFHGTPHYQEESCSTRDMLSFGVPMGDLMPPSDAEVRQAIGIIRHSRDNKLKIYFHCATGKDRTGIVRAVYRMHYQDWSFDQAYAEWVGLGRHPWYWFWKFQLKKWSTK